MREQDQGHHVGNPWLGETGSLGHPIFTGELRARCVDAGRKGQRARAAARQGAGLASGSRLWASSREGQARPIKTKIFFERLKLSVRPSLS